MMYVSDLSCRHIELLSVVMSIIALWKSTTFITRHLLSTAFSFCGSCSASRSRNNVVHQNYSLLIWLPFDSCPALRYSVMRSILTQLHYSFRCRFARFDWPQFHRSPLTKYSTTYYFSSLILCEVKHSNPLLR